MWVAVIMTEPEMSRMLQKKIKDKYRYWSGERQGM